MTINLPTRTAIVCYDAGAANIAIEMLLKTARNDLQAYMLGPAANLWKASFPKANLCVSLEKAMQGAELLITGSGWESNIEHDAREKASHLGIKSIGIIDHWVNYTERFVRKNKKILPDELWVTDKYALKIALSLFPEKPILQVPNYYLEKQLTEIAKIKDSSKRELLYILEPIRTNWNREISGEFQALDYFVAMLPKLKLPFDAVIKLRPHPSEPNGKYDHWIHENSHINIHLDQSNNIAESLGRASWVAGCESFALVIALMAGRITYCTLPPWAPKCQIPYDGLIQLREL